MTREEFEKFIEYIGFKSNDILDYYHYYKQYRIDLYYDEYGFYNGSKWFYYGYNDLTPLKQIERSYKLKKILG